VDVGAARKFVSDPFIGGGFVADECDDGVFWVAGQDGNERPLYRLDLDWKIGMVHTPMPREAPVIA
jgi:hypothetical protein